MYSCFNVNRIWRNSTAGMCYELHCMHANKSHGVLGSVVHALN